MVVGSQGRIVAGDNRFAYATSWGMGVLFGQYYTDHFSGAQLNPAVTIALYVHRPTVEQTPRRVVLAIVAQIIGAFMGFGWNLSMSPDQFNGAVAECGPRCGTEMLAALPVRHLGKMALLEVFWSTWVGFAIPFATSKMQKFGKHARYSVIALAVWVAIFLCPMPVSLNPASEVGRRSVAKIKYGREASSKYAAIGICGPILGIDFGFRIFDGIWTDRKLMVEAGDATLYSRPSFLTRQKQRLGRWCSCFGTREPQDEIDLEMGEVGISHEPSDLGKNVP